MGIKKIKVSELPVNSNPGRFLALGVNASNQSMASELISLINTIIESKVANVLDYCGPYDASSGSFPLIGSGTGGQVLKGDLFIISVAGLDLQVGDFLIANKNSPGQIASNWGTFNTNISYVPENQINKSIDVKSDAASDVKYPSVKSIKDYTDSSFEEVKERPLVQPAIVTGDTNSLTLNLNNRKQALFEPCLSADDLCINVDYTLSLLNASNGEYFSKMITLSGNRVIIFPSDFRCSEPSEIGVWDNASKTLVLSAGSEDVIILIARRYKSAGFWDFSVSANIAEKQIKFGRLYNWYAAGNPKFAPKGWHVPSHTEWNTLNTTLGGSNIGGGKMKEAGFDHWQEPNIGANNESGLTMLPGGRRNRYDGQDYTLGQRALFWTSDIHSSTSNRTRTLRHDVTGSIAISQNHHNDGLSVRLIKDDSTLVDSLVDIDGNVYPVIQIGDQVWIAANWACTKLNNGEPIPNVVDAAEWTNLTTMGMCAYNNDESLV